MLNTNMKPGDSVEAMQSGTCTHCALPERGIGLLNVRVRALALLGNGQAPPLDLFPRNPGGEGLDCRLGSDLRIYASPWLDFGRLSISVRSIRKMEGRQ